MTARLSAPELAAWRSLAMMIHLVDLHLERQVQADAGMPHSHYKVMVLLSEAPHRTVGLKELADTLQYSQSRISHALRALERAQLVRREPTPEPGRAQQAVLTDDGLQLVRRIGPLQIAAVRAHVLADLTPLQVEHLQDVADTIVATLQHGAPLKD
ncbi:MarR family winged helix-turn-helix transcriptional regulator [Planotetraspora kaengkrachanensis]|uniref:MarR family transcriptional regulator n=1 Tax=Planotetraspora kaengkrachanensis TaxID=575193 RepID=A0A8J3PSI6_9ACTN|nr:MarR family transcriptional regulator [Planotetraspora kaengkrachanensis]GIG79038.1 MarR family transcriptional regulator [Planotetraspora kaengkrachanensis]